MSETLRVAVRRAADAQDLPLPAYATPGAAGMDLRAALDAPLTLQPGARALISTGIAIALPPGFEAQVRPRSGLALRYGLGMVNAPGTVDSDFRGIIGVVLVNWGQDSVEIKRGDRIAQLVVAPVTRAQWDDRGEDALDDTARGAGGWGHTGRGGPEAAHEPA